MEGVGARVADRTRGGRHDKLKTLALHRRFVRCCWWRRRETRVSIRGREALGFSCPSSPLFKTAERNKEKLSLLYPLFSSVAGDNWAEGGRGEGDRWIYGFLNLCGSRVHPRTMFEFDPLSRWLREPLGQRISKWHVLKSVVLGKRKSKRKRVFSQIHI